MSNVLHIIPRQVFSCAYQGSYKDVIGRVELFKASVDQYRQVLVSEDAPSELLAGLAEFEPTHILIEYTSNPRIVTYLRKLFPAAFLAVRAINIEPLQNVVNLGFAPGHGSARVLYGSVRLFFSELTCSQKADAIYPISEWESEVYWQRLPGRAKVTWLPYFAPGSQIYSGNGIKRQDVIACVPGTVIPEFRRGTDLIRRFLRFAQAVRSISPKYEFVITGEVRSCGVTIPDYVHLPGLINDIAQLLKSVRAVALLSPLGYGFKTTIADAIANGCYPLLHPRHYKRGPLVLKDACIEVGSLDRTSLLEILEKLGGSGPGTTINNHLRSVTTNILKRDFC